MADRVKNYFLLSMLDCVLPIVRRLVDLKTHPKITKSPNQKYRFYYHNTKMGKIYYYAIHSTNYFLDACTGWI